MVRSAALMQHDHNRPDPGRIAGISVAILVNLTLFGLMMRPMSYTIPSEAPQPSIPIRIFPERLKPLPVVQEDRHQPPQPAAVTQVHVRTVVLKPPPVITQDPGPVDVAVQPPQLSSGIDDDRQIITPPVESSLVPVASPAPTYPVGDDNTGTVLLELLVGIDGRVISVRILHSSGDHRLDAAARDQVLRNWRFEPAMHDGRPVEALGRLPIVFKLDEQ